jgi:hypothetical protein
MIKNNFHILFLIIFVLLTKGANGQFTYGLQIQSFGGAKKGTVVADSITVVADSRASIKPFGVPSIGLFIEYKPKIKLPLLIRSEINYRPNPIGLDLTIYNGRSFGGKPDAVYTPKTLNFAFDLPLTICYNIVQKEKASLLKLKNLEVGVLAGVAVQLTTRGERETYPIAKNFNSPGISDANFAIYDAIRTTNYFYNYGIRMRLGHFIATYRRDMLLTNSGTNDLSVWGNTYSFRTNYDYQSISLGYTFSFKKKDKR